MTETCCCTPASQTPVDPCCPVNGEKGKGVQLITLKSLLKPSALEELEPNTDYFFCGTPDCQVVYFNSEGQIFTTDQIKVPVFQKDEGLDVPVCYCFGWTRERIQQEITQTGRSSAEISIRNHVRAKRCGCEVNNPQGSCCLANVRQVTRKFQQDEKK
ncbi:MAG: (2Fe-2S)-binding protein [Cyanobacteria bacterium J083]|nr:MAG: (2Fe-2S)-binding protein [Cyanobacteria bacterium J083]